MISNFLLTVAGQKLLANIASIAQSLRVIAEVMKEHMVEIKKIKEEK